MDLLKLTKEEIIMVKGLGNKSLYVDLYDFIEINRLSFGMNEEQIAQIDKIILPNGKELS